MNATEYSLKLSEEMSVVRQSMVEPGYDDFVKYREALTRWQTLKWAKDQLKLETTKDDEPDQ